MRKTEFITGCYYHVYNRGVDKRDIFVDPSDHYRFIHDLYEFNDEDSASNLIRRLDVRGSLRAFGPQDAATSNINRKKRNMLVDIVCFCLMPNHYHLILQQKKEGGITKFMRKLGTGYTMYFNKKNERTGSLFGNRFRDILIENDEYLMHLSRYIHLNPLELMGETLKTKDKIATFYNKDIDEFLKNYRWSSYPDYVGRRNFPSIINKKIIEDYFTTQDSYKNFIIEYTAFDNSWIENLTLEE